MSTDNLSLSLSLSLFINSVVCYYCKMSEVFSEPHFQLLNFPARYEIFEATKKRYPDDLDC